MARKDLICALSALLLVGSGFRGRAAEQPAAPSVSQLVDLASGYVGQYEEDLTAIVAEETYTQQIQAQIPSEPNGPRTRTLKSETFFTFAPATREWMAIRDVQSVDGKPPDDRPDVRSMLQQLPPSRVSNTLKTYNSRFNIGRTFRNFNEPTLSLLVLDRSHRDGFAFRERGIDHDGDVTLVTVGFAERKSGQTLIRDLHLKPVPSNGELVIEADSGRVRGAVLRMDIHGVRAVMSTTYGPDEKLGIWVPVLFRERYEHGVDPQSTTVRMNTAAAGSYEEILCEARYTNFRRFTVTARIK